MCLILGLLLTVCVLGAVTQAQLIQGNSLSLVRCSFSSPLNKRGRRTKGGIIIFFFFMFICSHYWCTDSQVGFGKGEKQLHWRWQNLLIGKGSTPAGSCSLLSQCLPRSFITDVCFAGHAGHGTDFQQGCLKRRVREGRRYHDQSFTHSFKPWFG